MNQSDYGKTIRNYRERNAITQIAVANHLGFTREHLSQIEHGKDLVKPEKYQRIMNAIKELAINEINKIQIGS